ncbi:MAG: DNA-3-methyladenine glycosylase 2 family protein [Bacteroidota bacterium]|nr:DNA-3-methyladenine glycosylase 2 family protein [Bacteroidota bacterium]
MEYVTHLSKDRKLRKLIQSREPFALQQRRKVYLHLCGSIVSQQLSTKVADVIWSRFLNLYDKHPTPEQILATPLETLRSVGLSNAKARYVQNVAQFALEKGMEWSQLKKMSDEEVIAHLTQIKGVGRWTVEMLLMFALGREDVFAVDDLGIQNAMSKLYKINAPDKKQLKLEMQRISSRWSPYRSYACLHLWKWKDNSPEK